MARNWLNVMHPKNNGVKIGVFFIRGEHSLTNVQVWWWENIYQLTCQSKNVKQLVILISAGHAGFLTNLSLPTLVLTILH